MQNPWTTIGALYVHPNDEPYLRQYNQSVTKEEVRARLDMPAQPYQGDPQTARMKLLLKNPSYHSEADVEAFEQTPGAEEQWLRSLTFESEYPFHSLDPRFAQLAEGRWWNNSLKHLLAEGERVHQTPREEQLRRLAAIQWHPYHSKQSFDLKEWLFTQEYNFALAQDAARRGALVVLPYGAGNRGKWAEILDKRTFTEAIRLKSQQTMALTRTNMAAEDFDRLVAALSAKE